MAGIRTYRLTGTFIAPEETGGAETPPLSPGTEQPAAIRPALLTVEEAARYLSIGRSRMFDLLAGPDPAIPSVKIGGSRRVRVADLDAYVERLAQSEERNG